MFLSVTLNHFEILPYALIVTLRIDTARSLNELENSQYQLIIFFKLTPHFFEITLNLKDPVWLKEFLTLVLALLARDLPCRINLKHSLHCFLSVRNPWLPDIRVRLLNLNHLLLDMISHDVLLLEVDKKVLCPKFISFLLINHELVVTGWEEL